MILWNRTQEEFGYGESEAKTKWQVIVACDNCKIELKRIYSSYNQTVKKTGRFYCHDCATKNKKFREECSHRAKKKWKDEQYKENNLAVVRSDGYREKKSERSKELWQDNEYVEKQFEIRQSDEFRKSVSDGVKEVWKNSEYCDKISGVSSIRLKEKWRDDEYRRNMAKHQHLNTTKMWKEKRDELMRVFSSSGFKEKMVGINNEILSRPEVLNKLSKASKLMWKNPEYKEKMTIINKEIWQDPRYKEKMAVIRANQPRVSNIQMMLYSILDDLGIKYYCEYEDKPNDPETVIGPYSFDCVIPRENKPDLLIECQGDYWHSFEKAIRIDKSKSTYIERYYSGNYELKYLWEHEFYCKDRIIELLKYWLDIDRFKLVDFDFSNAKIIYPCKAKDYKLLLSKYHYLPNAGRGGLVYGGYLGDKLVAVCVFSPLIRQNIRTGNYKPEECRELSRLCIHPRYQKKNFGSWFISRCLKLLDKKYKLIISYCDTTFNHDGALYKACNFRCDGVVKPDYWYVGEDGWVMHKKTLYGRAVQFGMKERDFAEKYSYRKVYGEKKLRFIYER